MSRHLDVSLRRASSLAHSGTSSMETACGVCGWPYCLPYPLHETVEQFNAAYPEADRLRRIKQQLDPAGKLSNELWRKYL